MHAYRNVGRAGCVYTHSMQRAVQEHAVQSVMHACVQGAWLCTCVHIRHAEKAACISVRACNVHGGACIHSFVLARIARAYNSVDMNAHECACNCAGVAMCVCVQCNNVKVSMNTATRACMHIHACACACTCVHEQSAHRE